MQDTIRARKNQLETHLQLVRESIRLEDLVAEHTDLRRSGKELAGLCPLHSERSPSFHVNVQKQVFHCKGCNVGGDIFEFVKRQAGCGFSDAVRLLANRAGIKLEGFTPSPELTAQVTALKAQRQEEADFKRFCNCRIDAINETYRKLSRAATHAEDYLRSGSLDPHLEEMAWDALERYRHFEASVEREGLCDLDILKTEWSKLHDAA